MPDPGILDEAAYARLDKPVGQAVGLPREAFTSEAFLAEERLRIFSKSWVYAARADALSEPGTALPVTIAGIPLVLTVAEDGIVRAFHNVCSHRGVLLATAPCSDAKLLRCPYHSWAYDLHGRLRATPHFGGHGKQTHADFDRAAHGLRPVRCARWHGLVFINLDDEGPSLAEHLAPLLERWSAYDFDLLRHGGSAEFEVAANWKLAVENFSESYHLPWVHPSLNGYSRMEDHYNIFVDGVGSGQGSLDYAPPAIGDKPLPIFPRLSADQRRRAEYLTIFPNLMIGVHPEYFFALTANPTSAATTHEELHFFFVGDDALAPEHAVARQDAVARWRQINLEDMDVVTRMQVGRGSPAMRGGCFAPELDACVHDFQLRVARAMRRPPT